MTLEIGCGHGHFLSAYADAYPSERCLGVDILRRRLTKALRKKRLRNLANLDFLSAEGSEIIEALPPNVSVTRVFIIFPDPWPKKRHHKKRLIQSGFLRGLGERVEEGGELCFRTDHLSYFDWTRDLIDSSSYWKIDSKRAWPFEEETFFETLFGEYQSLVAVRGESSGCKKKNNLHLR